MRPKLDVGDSWVLVKTHRNIDMKPIKGNTRDVLFMFMKICLEFNYVNYNELNNIIEQWRGKNVSKITKIR